MNFEITSNPLDQISADGVLVFVFDQKGEILPTQGFLQINKTLNGVVSEEVKSENFKASAGNLLTIHSCKKVLAPKVFVLGLGKKEEFDQNKLRRAIASFTKALNKKISSVALMMLGQKEVSFDSSLQAQAITEGFLLGSYNFNKYKKKEPDEKEMETIIFSEDNKNVALKMKEGIDLARVLCDAVGIARDLVNEPAAVVTPTSLAQLALQIAKKSSEIKCTVYERDQLEKMGMGAFLGVAQGADTAPKFIHLEYLPKGIQSKKKKIAIVGKGITFDSGGLSIKTEGSMKTMKTDMAGAAVVLGIFSVISKIRPSVPVMGLIAATPNLISGRALVPGDILRAMNGKTIEVLSTDAEGRVTLADSLSYAVKKGASEIIDIATLTGACMVALGTDIAGFFSNNESLKNEMKQAANKTGERLWELPLVKEYQDLNKSEVADISNIPTSRHGGAITAALFLEEFVDNKPWVHLDVAGPAFAEKSFELGSKGGTGFGVRLILNYLKNL